MDFHFNVNNVFDSFNTRGDMGFRILFVVKPMP